MRMCRTWGRFRAKAEGVASVEFALTLPIFLLIGLGGADAAMLVHHKHRVKQGLELAGSYISKSSDPLSVATQARNLAVTGEIAGGQARIPGWQTSDITVTTRSVAGSYRNSAKVVRLESTHTYASPLGFLSTALRRPLTIKGSHEARLG